MKTLTYRTSGVCSKEIHLSINDDGTIAKAEFVGGCPGNTAGISKLIVGMPADRVADLLRGNTCGFKSTSCPDQLAKAIDQMLAENA